jgi:hypothetical protein
MTAEPNHCSATRWVARNFEPSLSQERSTLTTHILRRRRLTLDDRSSRRRLPLLAQHTNRNHGAWKVGYVMFSACARDRRPGLCNLRRRLTRVQQMTRKRTARLPPLQSTSPLPAAASLTTKRTIAMCVSPPYPALHNFGPTMHNVTHTDCRHRC